MDQQRDITHRTLYNILQERPGIEPLIKQASVGVSLDNLPNSAFADTYNRAYPVDTPANTAMSLAYAIKTADLAPHVSSNLSRAAEIYGIILPPKAQVKVAHEEPRYLLPKQKKFGIKTASDVPKAEAALKRVSSKLSTEDLATAATVLVKAAADSDQNVSSIVMQWAGLAQCDLEKAAEWIEAREDSLSGKANGVFAKVASVVRAFDSENTRDDLVKIAETVGKLDEVYGLQVHYNRKLPNPMETVFNTKTSMEKMVSLAGTDVPLADLMKKDPEFYGDVLGDDILPEITTDGKLDETKLVEELPILPADMLKLLVSKMGYQVKEAEIVLPDEYRGVFPTERERSAQEQRLSNLEKLIDPNSGFNLTSTTEVTPASYKLPTEAVVGGAGVAGALGGLAGYSSGVNKARKALTSGSTLTTAAKLKGGLPAAGLGLLGGAVIGGGLGSLLGFTPESGGEFNKDEEARERRDLVNAIRGYDRKARISSEVALQKAREELNQAREGASRDLDQARQQGAFQSELNYLRGLSDLNPTSTVSNPVQYQQFDPLEEVAARQATFDEERRQASLRNAQVASSPSGTLSRTSIGGP